MLRGWGAGFMVGRGGAEDGHVVMEDVMATLAQESPAAWAAAQFEHVDLGDLRRTRRAARLAAQIAEHPAASLPTQTGVWRDTKAGYRLFDCEEVTFEALQTEHRRQVCVAAGQRPLILLIQDTTELDYTGHLGVVDLGPIGDGRGRGFLLHSTLAVDPTAPGEVLGLADQQLFLREPAPAQETRTERKRRKRESRVWPESVQRIGAPPSECRWVHVTDRGADDFAFFEACVAERLDYLTRVYQDRRMAAGHEALAADDHLLQWARSLPAWGRQAVELRRRPQRMPRVVELQVAFGAVTLFSPRLEPEGRTPVRCWLVRAWEPQTPPGETPLEWVLLTSVAVETAEQAREVTRWYGWRWLVEEYHKCLKTGCSAEARQLETRARLEACLGLLAIVAVRLLQLKFTARQTPERPALQAAPVDHVRVLAAYRHCRVEDWSVYEFWREVAKLGGFLARKRDGEPGWQTLWRGWQKLDLMTLGANLLRREDTNCG